MREIVGLQGSVGGAVMGWERRGDRWGQKEGG